MAGKSSKSTKPDKLKGPGNPKVGEQPTAGKKAAAGKKKVEFTEQDRINEYEDTAREFLRSVLEVEFDERLITDESRLSDFSSCGLPDSIADATEGLKELYAAWDEWVVPVIVTRYHLAEVTTTVLLVDLFEQIERAALARRPERRS